jgi:hypothetical protein
VPDQNLSDAVYLPGPFPVARFDLSVASLTVNGGLNLLNSVGNAALNSIGLLSQPFDAYAGELITFESALGPVGGLAAGPTILLGAISRGIRSATAANTLLRAPPLVLGRQQGLAELAVAEGGRLSRTSSTVAKEIFKKNAGDIRAAERVLFNERNVPRSLEEALRIGGGQFSRAERELILSRQDLIDKTDFITR